MHLWLASHDARVRALRAKGKLEYGYALTPFGGCAILKSREYLLALYFGEDPQQLVDSSTAYQTQSTVILQNVATGLLEYRGAGLQVNLTLGVVVVQSILLALTFKAGFSADAAAVAARSAAVSYVNSLNPGDTLAVAALIAAVQTIPGVAATNVASPGGDVVPTSPVQVFRTNLGLVLVGSSGVTA